MQIIMEILIREVHQRNLVYEFDLISRSLFSFPCVSIDTEFPGTVFHPDGLPAHVCSALPPASFYAIMKRNVDALKLIQLGLTLSDGEGNLPTLGTSFRFVWQFNFRDFDSDVDLHNSESISLLKGRGIDFLKNKRIGVDSIQFASLFMHSALSQGIYGQVTWVTFHGPYDFGFLIKNLTGRDLPEDLNGFMWLVKRFFGPLVYDVKNIIGLFGLHGGLDRVARSLSLDRVAGISHQAGSGSLLTMQVYLALRKRFCEDQKSKTAVDQLSHAIYGLFFVS